MSEELKEKELPIEGEVFQEGEVKKPKSRRKTQRNNYPKTQEPKYKFFDLVRPIKKLYK
jgi:hypothetical protein